MVYSYYFEVPQDVTEELLNSMSWSKGQLISDIPVHVFENECHEETVFHQTSKKWDQVLRFVSGILTCFF
ncbi:hypothetical protein [Photobacterium lipolyticum]|uniref:Uncharacterized protein n=1 Tax=Photobacterium lipolyticum TaxID=266810 RepID=A0A2T3MZR9_9GAMM|nr:hypothetical protein [Photobacterium lipolyticum]PSW05442.1 hypothetical protein C9I89_09330 [Photobacterium lipolyticum]